VKKLGLIALAVVMALGAMGVGYAYWFDTFKINGTVTTGSLVVGIKDLEDQTSYEMGGAVTTSDNSGAAIGQSGYFDEITETISNAYPGYATKIRLSVKNLGTVPVKFGGFQFSEPALDPGYTPFNVNNIDITAWSLTVAGVPVAFGGPVPSEAVILAALGDEEATLASGDVAELSVSLKFKEAMQNDTMNQQAKFAVTVIAHQFNDPAPIVPAP
jgi:hypothetical protein